MKTSDLRICTAYLRTPDGRPGFTMCGEDAPYEVADTFFCDDHRRRALQWAEDTARRQIEEVYYVQRADGLIKVGTSRTAATRLETIARQHGPLVLLAIHGGGRKEEATVHSAFRPFHVGAEWFQPGLPLLEHIGRVRKVTGHLEREDSGLPPRMNRIVFGKMLARARREAVAVTVAVSADHLTNRVS